MLDVIRIRIIKHVKQQQQQQQEKENQSIYKKNKMGDYRQCGGGRGPRFPSALDDLTSSSLHRCLLVKIVLHERKHLDGTKVVLTL